MTTTVWMDGWQLECCGEPFTVGQQVSWSVHESDREWLEKMLGVESAREIGWAEDHHGSITEDETSLSGIVISIRVVHQRYEPVPGQGSRNLYPVTGSATLTSIQSTGQHGRVPDGRQLVGYVVELEASAPAPA